MPKPFKGSWRSVCRRDDIILLCKAVYQMVNQQEFSIFEIPWIKPGDLHRLSYAGCISKVRKESRIVACDYKKEKTKTRHITIYRLSETGLKAAEKIMSQPGTEGVVA